MRFRTPLAAAVGALALAVTLPTSSASAATGQFVFTYERDGKTLEGYLRDPRARYCLTLEQVAGTDTTPAHSPRNRTNSIATVYTDVDCEGESFALKSGGGYGGENLKFRSVVFNQ
ncbi:peptidase inhibitor family I36 protein [Streptomyces lavendulae]|uniref:peptidase inhibitor family I36 protein n=1 Tax=Streptomyces lavendulae TaxID=1914 RepID=UPI0033D9B22B